MSPEVRSNLNLPVGFRFVPTDEELVTHYLLNKVNCRPLPAPVISEISNDDLYSYDPTVIPAIESSERKDVCFFTPKDWEFHSKSTTDQIAGDCCWRVDGSSMTFCNSNMEELAVKRTLVFYSHGEKTSWIMDEFYVKEIEGIKENWALCRIQDLDALAEESNTEDTTEESDLEAEEISRALHRIQDLAEESNTEDTIEESNLEVKGSHSKPLIEDKSHPERRHI